MTNSGYLMWPDGRVETLPPTTLGWRKSFAGTLLDPRTGNVLCQWGWGFAHFEPFVFHPGDKFCPLFDNDDYTYTIYALFPVQVLRIIFLYMAEEAARMGAL